MSILYLVATPIGNLEDISLRALRTLKEVKIIACEDTRKTGLLLKKLNIPPKKLISYYSYNEEKRVPQIISLLKNNQSVALVSEAGTPLISDPGFKIVAECLKQGIKVEPIPGPSAVITALIASGLPSDKFLFLGYLSKKTTRRKKILENLKKVEFPLTIILFESPYRVKNLLNELEMIFGNIEIVFTKELTKKFEKIIKDKIENIKNFLSKNPPKGEITLLFRIPQD
ncbi:MAG: 16S rRNA (cytidine(1402)-2'-O)-methyltransferase [Microgenomates group bacterium]